MSKRPLSPARKAWFDSHKDQMREYQAKYKSANKEKLKMYDKERKTSEVMKAQRLKRYGLTLQRFNELRSIQEYRCAICKVHESELRTSLCVDHDHDTGKVRGLLCDLCNRALGLMRDCPEFLDRDASYIRMSKVY